MKKQLQKFLNKLRSISIVDKQAANDIALTWFEYRKALVKHLKKNNQETNADVITKFIDQQLTSRISSQDMKKILEAGTKLPHTGEIAASFAPLEQIVYTRSQELIEPLIKHVQDKNLESFYKEISRGDFDPNIVSGQGKPLVQCLIEQNTPESIEAAQVIVSHLKFDANTKIKYNNENIDISDYFKISFARKKGIQQIIDTLKARKVNEARIDVPKNNIRKNTVIGKFTALLSKVKNALKRKFGFSNHRSR